MSDIDTANAVYLILIPLNSQKPLRPRSPVDGQFLVNLHRLPVLVGITNHSHEWIRVSRSQKSLLQRLLNKLEVPVYDFRKLENSAANFVDHLVDFPNYQRDLRVNDLVVICHTVSVWSKEEISSVRMNMNWIGLLHHGSS